MCITLVKTELNKTNLKVKIKQKKWVEHLVMKRLKENSDGQLHPADPKVDFLSPRVHPCF